MTPEVTFNYFEGQNYIAYDASLYTMSMHGKNQGKGKSYSTRVGFIWSKLTVELTVRCRPKKQVNRCSG